MTASLPLRPHLVPLSHEHGWVTESAHRTSEGTIVYVRCAGCGMRRVDLREAHDPVAAAHSRTIAAARDDGTPA